MNDFLQELKVGGRPMTKNELKIKELKKKYENAVADYELEKYKNSKAIEYIKEHSDKLKTTRVPKIDFNYNEVLEILGDKE